MTRQTTGWQSRAIHNADNARKARNALLTKLKRERVDGSEHTPAELIALHEQLKEDFYAREALRRATA